MTQFSSLGQSEQKFRDHSKFFFEDWEYIAYGFDLIKKYLRNNQALQVSGNQPYISGGSKTEAFVRTQVADRWDDQRYPAETHVATIFQLHLLEYEIREEYKEILRLAREHLQAGMSRYVVGWQ